MPNFDVVGKSLHELERDLSMVIIELGDEF
jgi:hypothetical protein